MKFNERFLEDILNSGWSRNYVSKEFNINRGLLHKYFNGTQLIPQNTFNEIIEAMVIPYSEKTVLCDLYYAELFGEDVLHRIKNLEHILLGIDQSCISDKSFVHIQPTIDVTELEKNDKLYLKTQTDILSAVCYLFEVADKGEIYTNYPYSCTDFDNMVFNCCLVYQDFKLFHLLVFNKIADCLENVQNIFCSVRYLQYGINPLCLYNYGGTNEMSPFPFFFAVGNYCLLFSSDCTQGFLYKDADMFSYIKNGFYSKIEESTELAVFPKDMLEVKNIVSCNIKLEMEMTLTRYPCLAPIADADFIYSILNLDVPGIQQLAELAVHHYANAFGEDTEKYIIHESGMREFAKTGKVYEVPGIFVKPASKKERIRYFETLKKLNENGRLKVINCCGFDMPSAVTISLLDQWLNLYGHFENVPKEQRFSANWIISMNDKQVFEDIKLLCDYLLATSNFYTQKGADEFLNSMIISLE